MRVLDDREAADAFWSDLHRLRPRPARRARETGEAVPRGPLTSRLPEPFFGDAPGQSWQVVGGPGALFTGLRKDDVVVRRRDDGGWDATLAGDGSPSLVFSRSGRLRRDTLVLRRQRAQEPRPFAPPDEQAPAQAPQTCGFFGAHNIVRTEAMVRAAIVGSANAEWSAWHTAGRPRFETDAGMFGRLVAYCAAADGSLKPDTLLAIQFAAIGTINYAPLLAAATANAAATAAAALAPVLTALAPAEPGLAAIAQRIALQARDARRDALPWSAAFVVTCARGAGMSLGLETIVGVNRRHVVPAPLLFPSFAHADYTREARQRRASGRRGTYHAFTPIERAPQAGDIIVVDRQATTLAGVVTLAGLGSRSTHGDIVIEIDREHGHVETVGGNLSDGSENPTTGEESVRKRRYPIDARGLLVRDVAQRFTQEDNTGTLPALPDRTTAALHKRSTARIFALLSPIEDCRAAAGRT